MKRVTLRESFESKYIPVPESGCWLWLGASTGRYGIIQPPRPRSHVLMAHRVSWEIHYGPIPPGLNVCHRCDVTFCVNPGHLFLGSQQDNVQDMIAKGRKKVSPLCGKHGNHAKGIENGQSKVDEITVHAIRHLYDSGDIPTIAALARRFNLSESQTARIVHRQSWKHLSA